MAPLRRPSDRLFTMRSVPRALLLAATLAVPGLAQADLGLGKMWTFERPPLEYLQREYGFAPDAEWLHAAMLASLRFGNMCSASFVSPRGLILTNHHCAREVITKAQGDKDWVRDGFVAASLADEVRLPDLTVQQLVKSSDVTKAMLAGIGDGEPLETAAPKRKKNEERILTKARAQHPDLTPQVVPLFHGAVWQLYQYRKYDDIRLVMAPHLQVAHFGGDPDNFTFPRFAIDFCFCRAWQGEAPADTSAFWFRWSTGPAPEELVFLTGNPGGTQRLLTMAQLHYLRDVRFPQLREMIDSRLVVLRRAAAGSSELEKRLRTSILRFENGQKLYRGEHAALLDPAFMSRKEAAERNLRERIAADPALQRRYGNLWTDLAATAGRRRQTEAPAMFHSAAGFPLLLRALCVVEAAAGNAAKAAEARAVRIDGDPVQRALFVDHLERARRGLPDDDPYLALVMGKRSPEEAVHAIEGGSRLGDEDLLADLLQGGAKAVARSDDLAIRIARELRPLITAAQCAHTAVRDEEEALAARLARAVFAIHGNAVSPDATFTLRFSDGRVRGYEYNGTKAPWRTSFYGMYARSAEFDGAHPFDLPQVWLDRKDRLDLSLPVDFVCTVDSTGGNSGSPLINSKRELVGLLFDGNIESLGNEFFYGETVERSVCVHPRAIEEALLKVYDAPGLVQELRGR
jgi:Peptidase S46